MFALLKMSCTQIETVRRAHGIYIVEDGRINVAGLPAERATAFVKASPRCHDEVSLNDAASPLIEQVAVHPADALGDPVERIEMIEDSAEVLPR
jgi:hypothetical protein